MEDSITRIDENYIRVRYKMCMYRFHRNDGIWVKNIKRRCRVLDCPEFGRLIELLYGTRN